MSNPVVLQDSVGERGVELEWVQGHIREFDLGRTTASDAGAGAALQLYVCESG